MRICGKKRCIFCDFFVFFGKKRALFVIFCEKFVKICISLTILGRFRVTVTGGVSNWTLGETRLFGVGGGPSSPRLRRVSNLVGII